MSATQLRRTIIALDELDNSLETVDLSSSPARIAAETFFHLAIAASQIVRHAVQAELDQEEGR